MHANIELTVEAKTPSEMQANQRYPLPGDLTVQVVSQEVSEMEICSSNYNEPLELAIEVGGTANGHTYERSSCCNKVKLWTFINTIWWLGVLAYFAVSGYQWGHYRAYHGDEGWMWGWIAYCGLPVCALLLGMMTSCVLGGHQRRAVIEEHNLPVDIDF
jgi:hypothetical protein